MKGFYQVIFLVIGAVIAVVAIGGSYMPQVFGTNTDSWDTGTANLWSLLGLLGIVLVFTAVLGGGKR